MTGTPAVANTNATNQRPRSGEQQQNSADHRKHETANEDDDENYRSPVASGRQLLHSERAESGIDYGSKEICKK
jgi:hypothetical protein